MQRSLGLGYQSAWAQAHLPSRYERNNFFTEIGCRSQPEDIRFLRRITTEMTPDEILSRLGS
jgi:hypothetical protein